MVWKRASRLRNSRVTREAGHADSTSGLVPTSPGIAGPNIYHRGLEASLLYANGQRESRRLLANALPVEVVPTPYDARNLTWCE